MLQNHDIISAIIFARFANYRARELALLWRDVVKSEIKSYRASRENEFHEGTFNFNAKTWAILLYNYIQFHNDAVIISNI